MTKPELLYKLTGTEKPRFITERENAIIDKCLDLINEPKEAITVTRCSTQLKLVYTSGFCRWLETGFTYYDKTNDFLNKKGYRMTFKELVSKYEREQKKKALIV